MSKKAARRKRSAWQVAAWLVVFLTPFLSSSCLDRSLSKKTLISYDVLYETPAQRHLVFEDVYLTKKNGETLHGWWLPEESPKGCILMFHGNLVNISYVNDYLQLFHEWGYQVFVFDYQGFARSTGRHSVKELWMDANAAYQYVRNREDVDPQRIGVYGYSLGSPVALALAARQPEIRFSFVEGLINPQKLMKGYFGGVASMALPLVRHWLLPEDSDPRDSLARMGDRPVMVVQRGDDGLAENIGAFLLASPEWRRFEEFPGASHVSFLIRDDEFRAQMKFFFADGFSDEALFYATLEDVHVTDDDYHVNVHLHNGDWQDGQPATFYFFNDERVCSTFYWTLQAGQRDYTFTIPGTINGHSTDDATARFNLDDGVPGWSLLDREIKLHPARSGATVKARYLGGRKQLQAFQKKELSLRPEAVAVTLRHTPVNIRDAQFQAQGLLLVTDKTSDIAEQEFFGMRWEGSQWDREQTYCELIEGDLSFTGDDRELLLQEIEKDDGQDWMYSLRKLLQLDGLIPKDSVHAKLYTSFGFGVVCDVLSPADISTLLLTGLQLQDGMVQRKIQKALRQGWPMIDFLPRPRSRPLSPETLQQLQTWFADNGETCSWDFKQYHYVMPEDRPEGYNFLDNTPFEYRLVVKPEQSNIVSLRYREYFGFGHHRRVVYVTLNDPVKAQYAMLTDQVMNMIETAFPDCRNNFLTCAATKIGMVPDGELTLDKVRTWFEEHYKEMKWNEELRLFVLE